MWPDADDGYAQDHRPLPRSYARSSQLAWQIGQIGDSNLILGRTSSALRNADKQKEQAAENNKEGRQS
jgi:hypothetical protein